MLCRAAEVGRGVGSASRAEESNPRDRLCCDITRGTKAAFLSPLVGGHEIDLGVGELKFIPMKFRELRTSLRREAARNDCGKQTSKIRRDTGVQRSAAEAFAGGSAIRADLHL